MNNFTCPNCSKTSFPAFVLNDTTGKLVAQCTNGECLFTDNRLGPNDFNQGIAAMPVDGSNGAAGWASKQQVLVTTETERAPAAHLRPFGAPPIVPPLASGPLAPAPYRVAAPAEPTDVITMIEQRSLWLGSEEARLEGELAATQSRLAGIRAESKRLTKMLKAAQRTDDEGRRVRPAIENAHRN